MNPDELLALLQKATEARRRGLPADKINQRIAQATGGRHTNFQALAIAARDAGITRDQLGRAPAPEAPSRESGPIDGPATGSDAIRLAASGLTGGLLAEGAGLLAGIGAAIVPGGKGFSEAREAERSRSRSRTAEARQRLGPAGLAVEVGAGVVGPGRVISAGTRALGRATGTRGAAALAAGRTGAAARSLAGRLPTAARASIDDALAAVESGAINFNAFKSQVIAATRGLDVADDVVAIVSQARNAKAAAQALRAAIGATVIGDGNPVEGAQRVIGGLLGR